MRSTIILDKKISRCLFVGFLVLSWTVGAFFYFNPQKQLLLFDIIPLKCPLFNWTALKCPLCGLGHSLILAWTWNFQDSWHHHPLGVFCYFTSFLIAVALLTPKNFLLEFILKTRNKISSIPSFYWGLGLILITIFRNSR